MTDKIAIDIQKYRCLHLAIINLKLLKSNYFEMVDVLGYDIVDNLKKVLVSMVRECVEDPSPYIEDWNIRFEDLTQLNEDFI